MKSKIFSILLMMEISSSGAGYVTIFQHVNLASGRKSEVHRGKTLSTGQPILFQANTGIIFNEAPEDAALQRSSPNTCVPTNRPLVCKWFPLTGCLLRRGTVSGGEVLHHYLGI
jgi:hypothetical protein